MPTSPRNPLYGFIMPLLATVFSLLLSINSSAAAESQGEIDSYKSYKIQSSDPELVVTTVKEMIGADRKVFFDKLTSQLMVLAKTNEHKMIEMILKDINITPMNVQIEVTYLEGAEESTSGARVSGSIDIVKHPKRKSTDITIKPEIHSSSQQTASNTKQTLLVQSGKEASLLIGQEVPYIDRIIEFGRNWGYIQDQIVMRNVGAFLVIKPRVIGTGPYINVSVTPEISGTVDSKSRRIKYTRAATEVTISDGQTINIGGLKKDSAFYDTFLIGFNSNGKKSKIDISLTARIINPAPPQK